jgi:hypothetical protein
MRHRSIVLFIFILLLQMACADNRTMAEATAVTPLTNPTVIKCITGSPTATVELTAVSTATLAPTTTPTPAATSTPLPLPTSDSSQSNDWSNHPRISGDGQVVVFESNATNLVPEDNNDSTDIFVYDREQGQVARVSGTSDGTEANEIPSNRLYRPTAVSWLLSLWLPIWSATILTTVAMSLSMIETQTAWSVLV